MFLLYHAYIYLELLILTCTIYILAPVYIVVDMELKGLIREALIKMILGFDIALEIEEE